MKLKKSSYGLIAFSILLFVNPNFNAFDFFPDFIGLFIIAAIISRAAEIVPFFAEARDGFLKAGILSLVRLPAAVLMYGNIYTGMDIVPLFTLVFCVIELLLLFPAVMNLYRGLAYLGERSCAVGIVEPTRLFGVKYGIDGARNFTLVFLSVRALLNFLPQICHLTFSDERTTYIAKRLYAPLEISMLSIAFIFGICFAVVTLSLLFAVKGRGGVADGIIEMAGEERLSIIRERSMARGIIRSLYLVGICAIFNLEIAFESTGGFNILPRFIFAFILLFAIWNFIPGRTARGFATAITSLYSIVSTGVLFLCLGFSDEFDIVDLATNTVAQGEYATVKMFALTELGVFSVLVIIFAVMLCKGIKRHTGILPNGGDPSRATAEHHSSLCKKGVVLSVWLFLTGVMRCVNMFLIGSPIRMETQNGGIVYGARLPWFGTATFVVSLLLVFYAFYLSSTLRDEVRLKYDIPKKGEI